MMATGHGASIHSGPPDLLHVYVAEYNALTTRCTYWITVQVAMLSLILILIGVGTQAWQYFTAHHDLLVFVCILGVQLVTLGWLQIGLEIYTTVSYLECTLRPRLEDLVGGHGKVWSYETFLAGRRGTGPMFQEYILAVINIIVLTGAAVKYKPASGFSGVVLGLNVVLVVALVVSTWQLVRTRRDFTRCLPIADLTRSQSGGSEGGAGACASAPGNEGP
jgi:hypothetical protein